AEMPLALWRAATHRLPIAIRDFSRRSTRPRRTHVSAG
ncbi:MAG: hypothetical protein QOG74_2708, partial [Alphaproteobacteria bacterium]|nr:hypothetical protein [Alphaproteobacteria bacterium]